jgi:hypothetical protein
MMADLADQQTVRDNETPESPLDAYREQNAETLRVFAEADPDATIVVPDHIQLWHEDPQWTVRRALGNTTCSRGSTAAEGIAPPRNACEA